MFLTQYFVLRADREFSIFAGAPFEDRWFGGRGDVNGFYMFDQK